MNRTWVASFALVGAVGVAFLSLQSPGPSAQADEAAKPAFIGPDGCKKCHFKQHKAWKETPMAKAFERLKPNEAADKKKAAGLDPAKDYTKDPKCLACHTTGYGTESGYPAVVEGKDWTDEEKGRAGTFGGTTCEACHGPGSLYAPYKKANQETFKVVDIMKLGANGPLKADNCMICHKKECPTMPADYAWDFEKGKISKDVHEHVPLKHQH